MRLRGRSWNLWILSSFVGACLAASAGAGTKSVAAIATTVEVRAIEKAAGGRLLAIGRLDGISRDNYTATVLGQQFILLATASVTQFVSRAEIGDPVVLMGDLADGKHFADSAAVLPGQYVQGVSKVYLLGTVTKIQRHVATLTLGKTRIDLGGMSRQDGLQSLSTGSRIRLIGTQPVVSGLVLAEGFEIDLGDVSGSDASMGTGSTDASMGTGSTDASMGTGSPDASMGTGSPDASMGTGSPDASMGTGSTDASMGTGSTDASMGTGSPDASMGTGSFSS